MAVASIPQWYADGSHVDLVVDSDDNSTHPDLLDELVSRVLVLYREVCLEGES